MTFVHIQSSKPVFLTLFYAMVHFVQGSVFHLAMASADLSKSSCDIILKGIGVWVKN